MAEHQHTSHPTGQYYNNPSDSHQGDQTRTISMNLKKMASDGFNWAKENPGTAASGTLAAGGLAVVAAPALLTAPLLGVAGFGANGVIGGSLAAGIQAGIGNVAAQSTFAYLTSAAMGGYGAAGVAAAGQAVGAAAAVGGGVRIWKGQNCGQTEQEASECDQVKTENDDNSDKEEESDGKEEKGPKAKI